MSVVFILGGLLVAAFIVYVACPFIFYYSKWVRNGFLFANRLNLPHPKLHPLRDPSYFGLTNAENFTVSLNNKDCINIWSINNTMETGSKTVVVYCHGNSCNRAMPHRVGLYEVLQNNGFSVVAFDYRGFGDSIGGRPDEYSVVDDTRVVLDWTIERFPDHDVVMWAHSLGTGISIKLLSNLTNVAGMIKGLVLESPFLNSGEAGRHFPIAKVFNYLPFTRGVIGDALEGLFPSDELISNIPVPIFILHAKDDIILPVHNGIMLEKVCRVGGKSDVSIKVVDEGQHKYLYTNKSAMGAAIGFINGLVFEG